MIEVSSPMKARQAFGEQRTDSRISKRRGDMKLSVGALVGSLVLHQHQNSVSNANLSVVITRSSPRPAFLLGCPFVSFEMLLTT
jgi:uncharacterized RmlC-like cupin family protein